MNNMDQNSYIHLNNSGMLHLRQRDYDNAIRYFRYALGKVVRGLTSDPMDVQSSPRIHDSALSVVKDRSNLGITIYTPSAESLTSSDHDSSSFSDHNTLILHTEAFGFASSDPRELDIYEGHPRMKNESHFTNLVSGILLFNLGLSFHMRAIALKSHSEHLRAQHIYCSAKEVLFRRHHHLQDYTFDNGVRRLLLAVTNNMAHLSFHFYDIAGTKNHLSALRYLVFGGSQEEAQNQVSFDVHSDGVDRHFVLNALLSLVNIAQSSPAA